MHHVADFVLFYAGETLSLADPLDDVLRPIAYAILAELSVKVSHFRGVPLVCGATPRTCTALCGDIS